MEETVSKRLVIVGEQDLLREMLATALGSLHGFEVVRSCGHIADWAAAYAATPMDAAIICVPPDCANYVDTITALRALEPPVPVLALCIEASESLVLGVFHAGARAAMDLLTGLLELKRGLEDLLRTGFHCNALGELYLSAKGKPLAVPEAKRPRITEAEFDFLRLVSDPKEYTYRQMADLRGVSESAIHSIRRALFAKLNVRSRTGLVLAARAMVADGERPPGTELEQ